MRSVLTETTTTENKIQQVTINIQPNGTGANHLSDWGIPSASNLPVRQAVTGDLSRWPTITVNIQSNNHKKTIQSKYRC